MLKKILAFTALTFLLVGCATSGVVNTDKVQNGNGVAGTCDDTYPQNDCQAQNADLPLN